MTLRLRIYNRGFNGKYVEIRNAGLLCASKCDDGQIQIKVHRAGQFWQTWCDDFHIQEEWHRGCKPEIVKFPLITPHASQEEPQGNPLPHPDHSTDSDDRTPS